MIIKLFLIFGCGLILTIILGQLFIKRKSSANIILICLSIACAVWSCEVVIEIFNLMRYVPHLNQTQIPFLCITAPLWYLYVKCLVNDDSINKKTLKYMISSTFCSLVLLIPFYLQTTEIKLNYREAHFHDLTTIFAYIGTRIADITTIIFCCITLNFLQITTKKHTQTTASLATIKLMLSITMTALLAILIRVVGVIFDSLLFSLIIPSTIVTFAFAMLYCLSQRNPSLIGLNFIEKKKSKHGDTLLIEQYSQTIQEQELYLNPDITIAQLAKNLQTQVHNLSELINNTTNYNFKGFINTFRIEHAKMLLLENKSSSIMDIAYASGFNSKSVFYNHFLQATSFTPSQFRDNNFSNATVTK